MRLTFAITVSRDSNHNNTIVEGDIDMLSVLFGRLALLLGTEVVFQAET